MKKNLIVGTGISGAVLANLIATIKNEKVLIIDKRNHIAGNIFDFKDSKTNILIQKYGPHIFHTNNEKVWNFLSNYTKWHQYEHQVKANVEKQLITIPFSLATLYEIFPLKIAKNFENELISAFGYNNKITISQLSKINNKNLKPIYEYIYNNIYKNYTLKQWKMPIENLDFSISSRIPIYINFNKNYFQDKYQAIPQKGYTQLVENILKHKNITIKLNTDFKEIDEKFDNIFYSGSIDEFFNYKFSKLEYRSLYFKHKTLNREYHQPKYVINYPNDYKYTRITEHKHALNQKSTRTIITYEYPEDFKIGKNERYYPVISSKNNLLYEKYFKEKEKIKGLYFIGRLGKYRYLNIDEAIEDIFKLFEKL